MDKNSIKKFAIWARNKLIAEITYKAELIGITENGIAKELPESDSKLKLYDIGTQKPASVQGDAILQRANLVSIINKKAEENGYKQAFQDTIEEVAYTWFNRLIAIRFMEVNDFLPSGVRILSSESKGKKEPDMVTNPFETDIEFSDADRETMLNLKDDELFRFLFIKECNKLNEYLPELFEKTNNYSELLLNISFRDEDGIIYHLVNDISEEDFGEQVQIIGWLYQYYNSEPKDAVFANLKKNVKISKENIPAATQLFTPDWIVRYMVENSLGRFWTENHEDFDKSQWKYYLDEAEQEENVKNQLEKIRSEHENTKLEEIKFIDPCMGSGHILCYAFDVFMQIYTSQGYTERDAAQSIIMNNIYGLELDKRAYQLSYFALMMKGRQYDRRFLTREIKPNLAYFSDIENINTDTLQGKLKAFAEQFKNADAYGSLLEVGNFDEKEIEDLIENFNEDLFTKDYKYTFLKMLSAYKILSQKYEICCTNPPYMGGSGMSPVLADFVKKNYPDSKSDLFACFIERCGKLVKQGGFYSMITQHAFMFLSSYENLRKKLLINTTINMAHLGARAFDEIGGEVVQTTAFVNCNANIKGYKGTYSRLIDAYGEAEKEKLYLSKEKIFTAAQENFSKIPGSPVAYWVSGNVYKCFENGTILKKIAEPKQGMVTRDNGRFMRLWWETGYNKIALNVYSHAESKVSDKKWYPCTSGGAYRKWYGNIDSVVNFENDGEEIIAFSGSHIKNREYYFREAITWSAISSSKLSMRYAKKGFLPEHAGNCLYGTSEQLLLLQSFANSKVGLFLLGILSPTLNYNVGDIASLPILFPNHDKMEVIEKISKELIKISNEEWDSFELSLDFERNPLV